MLTLVQNDLEATTIIMLDKYDTLEWTSIP